MRNRLAFAFFTTVFFAITAHASLQMYLDKSFTIPGTNPITQLQFADWDRDGIPEVAALSSDNVVVYSITGDSIILSYRNDSIPANPVSILFADVTRDSIPDLVLQYVGNVVLNGDSVDVVLEIHDGSSMFLISKRTVHKGWGQGDRIMMAAFDVGSDLGTKVFLSHLYTNVSYTWLYTTVYDNNQLVTAYDTLPDVLDKVGGAESRVQKAPGGRIVVVEKYSRSEKYEGLGEDFTKTTTSGLVYKYPNTIYQLAISVSPILVGHFFGGDELLDVLYLSGSGVNCVTESWSLGGILNWTVPQSPVLLSWPLAELPFFPNHFVAAGNGKVIVYSASTGLPTDSCASPTTWNRRWEYPYADSNLRLVTNDNRKVEFWGFDEATGVNDPPIAVLPQRFELSNPYPNPFNPSVTISFAVPAKGKVQLEVFNLTGQRVATLLNDVVSAGTKTIPWDASGHASGVYYFRATFEEQTKTVKAILLK